MLFSFEKGTAVAFSPDGKILAMGLGDLIKLIDVSTGQELDTPLKNKTPASALAFSPDGKILASGWGKEIALWDFVTRKEIGTLKGHSDWISSVTFSSDGRRLVTKSQEGIVKI